MHVFVCMVCCRGSVLVFFVSAQAESRKRLELLGQEEGKSLGMEAAIAAEVKKKSTGGDIGVLAVAVVVRWPPQIIPA